MVEQDLIQRTLVIFKPDAVQRGIVGEILERFERVGLKIVATKMINPSEKSLYEHYEEIGHVTARRGQDALDNVMRYMSQGPVIAMVFEGVEAIEVVRKIVGPTEPKAADMGTIRGDYSHISFGYADSKHIGIPNLIHASADETDAKAEIAHWFSDNEIYTYTNLNEKYLR
ncbi:nucleoside-diphosphate kinase [Candidatus Saccharibacteria bacterium]|nr:nucleoside-diphosphate kinase [Candidatus Saccharibacteria bacterium]